MAAKACSATSVWFYIVASFSFEISLLEFLVLLLYHNSGDYHSAHTGLAL